MTASIFLPIIKPGVQRQFRFKGTIPASKSLLNRALILKSYRNDLELSGSSKCDDVQHLMRSLESLRTGRNSFHCGEGGTTLRFLAMRLSREPGRFEISAHPQLLKRPQAELQSLLLHLGVLWQQTSSNTVVIQSENGWQKTIKNIEISNAISSQFLSGLLLNCWNLPFDLKIETDFLDHSYLQMTLSMLKLAGMSWQKETVGVAQKSRELLTIPAHQKISVPKMSIESDLSSSFTVSAIAALLGQARLIDFPFSSTQPDLCFVEILRSMNVDCHQQGKDLVIQHQGPLKGIQIPLGNSPDLFPVLAALACFAEGPSRLDQAPQLIYKESNRILEVGKLLDLFEVEHRLLADGIEILGKPQVAKEMALSYTSPQDHRMAMAGMIFQSMGYNLQIKNISVLNKSFPELPEILQNGLYEENN